jgi:hypothetical protein
MWHCYQYTVALHNFWAIHEHFLKHFYLHTNSTHNETSVSFISENVNRKELRILFAWNKSFKTENNWASIQN